MLAQIHVLVAGLLRQRAGFMSFHPGVAETNPLFVSAMTAGRLSSYIECSPVILCVSNVLIRTT
jgi:hypothetical protein